MKLTLSRMRWLIVSRQIHSLFRMITYVSKNEETACVKLVHFYDSIENIPSELEANAKCTSIMVFLSSHLLKHCVVLDEAFPEITIDLVSALCLCIPLDLI